MTGLQACRRAIVQALETRRLLCINHDPMGFGGYPVDPDWTPPVVSEEDSVASIDVLQVPAYHSRPTAPQSIYLDFNGSPAIPAWGAWGPYTYKSVTESHAFDNDGNNDAFSTQELADIREIWMGVSEKFSPWNINVTTVKPNPINGARVVIGGDGAWNGSGGGVALIGTWGEEGVFDRIASNVCFVWANQDDTDYVIEAVAHEVGHVIGLHHMSDYPPTPAGEYLPGFIMGSGFKTEVGRWGHALHPTRTSSGRDGDGNLVDHGQQDDLDDIFKNGEDEDYAPVADVVGATNATSQLIQLTTTNGVTQGSASGLIETSSDADWYRIVHPGGRLDIDVLSAQFRGMLDPVVEV
ncbi:MAG TPA: hypothetical protein PK402_13680, partial [Tepidisphaeraceae bacterium]|nr:hypothetical protein [Tepidisphaeraceae bacterium]